ncbi:MAG TPA: hypothetical protein PK239_03990 [Chitinophagales bacterium]|nr:hypothetical protein [Chitinophagales bacterium]HRK26432.1 hypothetical protein [Chitinophagales bacterium]
MKPNRHYLFLFILSCWVALLVSCQPKQVMPTPYDSDANQCLHEELTAIKDCIADIIQPTDEELLYQTAHLLLNALACAHIPSALLYAKPEALSMLLRINIDQINNFEVKSLDVFLLKGVIAVYVNNRSASLRLVFSRTDKYAPWVMTSIK